MAALTCALHNQPCQAQTTVHIEGDGAATHGHRRDDDRAAAAVALTSAHSTVAVEPPHMMNRHLRGLLSELREARRLPPGQGSSYRHPTAPEQQAYRAFVTRYLLAAPERVRPLPPAGFSALASQHDRLWLLGEAGPQRGGAALLVLRAESPSRMLIEAPHTFFDAGTLPLAVSLFDALKARALIVNTVHRAHAAANRADLPREQILQLARRGKLASDAAHQRGALFSVAHQTLVANHPGMLTLQLHGYRDRRVPHLDAVVSAARSDLDIEPLVDRLRLALPAFRIGAYPRDTRDLGATRNVQARLSRELHAPFVHLELSSSLRDALRRDRALHRAFLAAISEWPAAVERRAVETMPPP